MFLSGTVTERNSMYLMVATGFALDLRLVSVIIAQPVHPPTHPPFGPRVVCTIGHAFRRHDADNKVVRAHHPPPSKPDSLFFYDDRGGAGAMPRQQRREVDSGGDEFGASLLIRPWTEIRQESM